MYSKLHFRRILMDCQEIFGGDIELNFRKPPHSLRCLGDNPNKQYTFVFSSREKCMKCIIFSAV